jgi:hypothetical protein
VVTNRCNDTAIDRDHWLVYAGSDTGFAATAMTFALPAGYTAFYGVSTTSAYCDSGRNVPEHVVMDMTGDGKPDLVVTNRCNDTTIDRDHWLVYANSGTGFAASPASFALPAGYTAFYGVSTSSAYCDSGRNVPQHLVMDLTGDAKPDLLVTDRCNDTTIDVDHWLLYANGGSGFAASPTTFTLPSGYTAFYGIATSSAYCDSGRNVPQHVVMDITGDAKPDLLVTDRCNDTTIDVDHWLVYAGSATGFSATPASFALPPGYTAFYGIATSSAYCDSGRNVPQHTVMDVGADGRLDLLVTDRCNDTTIDDDHWLVYSNSGTGFDATSTNFALPGEYSAFYGVATSSAYCDSGRNVPEHAMLDFGGDGRPDLVVTNRCNDAAIDLDHWLVYPNQCKP